MRSMLEFVKNTSPKCHSRTADLALLHRPPYHSGIGRGSIEQRPWVDKVSARGAPYNPGLPLGAVSD